MDMDSAHKIALEQLEKHRSIAKFAHEIGEFTIANDHRDIAEALEKILGKIDGVAKNGEHKV